jgi:hypothetical protein
LRFNAGILADYLLADACFGTKEMIRLTQETALVPVLRMKKNKMKYRLSESVRGNAGDTQQTVGKYDWAVFLTTDTALSETEILEL